MDNIRPRRFAAPWLADMLARQAAARGDVEKSMRLVRVRFPEDPRPTWGLLQNDDVVHALSGSPHARWQAGDLLGPLERAQLLAPVEPPNIFAIGRNYAEHAAELGNEAPTEPLVFLKPTTTILAPDAPIVLPTEAPEHVDYEAELAVVIGTSAARIAPDQASDHIVGYTCANDISARDWQRGDKQWTRGKGCDTFCPVGPWVVPAGELDPQNLRISSRLNGQTMQDASTSQMIHSVADLVSYLSRYHTLLPGTIILTGTPAGVGSGRTPRVFLRDGDVIEVEIEGFGSLRNPVTRQT